MIFTNGTIVQVKNAEKIPVGLHFRGYIARVNNENLTVALKNTLTDEIRYVNFQPEDLETNSGSFLIL